MLAIPITGIISLILYVWWKISYDERKEKENNLKEIEEKMNLEKELIEIYKNTRQPALSEISKINYLKLKDYYEFLKNKQ
jgi:hypothetical protein